METLILIVGLVVLTVGTLCLMITLLLRLGEKLSDYWAIKRPLLSEIAHPIIISSAGIVIIAVYFLLWII